MKLTVRELDELFESHTAFSPDPTRKLKTFTAYDVHRAAVRAYAECRQIPGDAEWFAAVALGISSVMTQLELLNDEAFYAESEKPNVGN